MARSLKASAKRPLAHDAIVRDMLEDSLSVHDRWMLLVAIALTLTTVATGISLFGS